jgi:hypothetical protein
MLKGVSKISQNEKCLLLHVDFSVIEFDEYLQPLATDV